MTATSTADRLRGAGERVTRQRLAVAEALAAFGRQISAQDLYDACTEPIPASGAPPSSGRSSRSSRPASHGASSSMGTCTGMSPAVPEHHHHLACDRCGRVEEIDEAYIRPVAERVAANLGFRIDDARVDFYGLCASCARRG